MTSLVFACRGSSQRAITSMSRVFSECPQYKKFVRRLQVRALPSHSPSTPYEAPQHLLLTHN